MKIKDTGMAAGVFYGAVRDTGDRLGQSYRAGGGRS